VNIYGFSISSKTEHPDEAMVLFEYLVSPEVQKKFVNNERITPMVGILEEDKISNDLARWQEIIEQGTGTIGFVVLEIPAEVSRQIFDVGAAAVWTEQMTPREWMEAMEIGHAELTNTEPVLNP
jgi:ABC-type glycerol-3-phosphate transport system substrate-binding protein